MFSRQLRTIACTVALCMGAGALPATAATWEEAVEDAAGDGAIDAGDTRKGLPVLIRLADAGDTGLPAHLVREAQRLLTELGHAPGPVDGKWGPRSQRAFDAWLRESGLGKREVDIRTLWEMRSAVVEARRAASRSARPKGPSLARFVCQQYDITTGSFYDRVLIAEQLSVQAITQGTAFTDTIDGSLMIDLEEPYSGSVAFRMRNYENVSLVSAEKTKDEIIRELLDRSASRATGGSFLMDYTGEGSRLAEEFLFISDSDSEPFIMKSLSIDLTDLRGSLSTNHGTSRMLQDGLYRCEPPVLVPVR